MLRSLVLLVAAALLFAGCAGSDPSKPAASSTPTTAPAPIVNETAGSITGTVVDDEQRPLAGVTVSVAVVDVTTKTDAAGAFTLNGIESGTHQIFFDRLGYEAAAKRVDVIVGEVTNVNVVLKPLTLGEESFVRTDQRTFYFNFAWYYVSRSVPIVNNSAINQQTCDPCVFHIPFLAKPKAVMTETYWQRSISQPGFNENIEPFYCIGWTISCTADGTLVSRANLNSRSGYQWSEAGAKALDKLELVRLEVLAGFPGVMVQQKGDIWTSFAYGDGFPDEFSVLPPV